MIKSIYTLINYATRKANKKYGGANILEAIRKAISLSFRWLFKCYIKCVIKISWIVAHNYFISVSSIDALMT